MTANICTYTQSTENRKKKGLINGTVSPYNSCVILKNKLCHLAVPKNRVLPYMPSILDNTP